MKGRQLLLSMTLLLVLGCCWRTTVFAQQEVPGQVSTEITGDFAVGEILTVTVTPSNSFTQGDLENAFGYGAAMFSGVTLNQNGSSADFELAVEPSQDFNKEILVNYFNERINSLVDDRREKGIDAGPAPVKVFNSPSDAATQVGNSEEDPDHQ